MQFLSLASSSKGNVYLVKAEGAAPLLIEAGLPLNAIRDKLREYGVSLSDLAGVLVSHPHGDHAKAVKDLLRAGLDCYMSTSTAQELGVDHHHRTHLAFTPGVFLIPGGWKVSTFLLEHDTKEPTGFVITHEDDRLLFIPDTASVKTTFSGITEIAIECNFVGEILVNNVMEGHIPACVGNRIRHSHFSLENLIAMLKASDLSRCRQIHLLHLSDGNSHEVRMVKEVQAATGIPTKAAC